MDFKQELFEKLRITDADAPRYSVTLCENKYLAVEGHKGVLTATAKEIKLRLPRGVLTVAGEDLTVCYLSRSEVCVEGSVAEVKFE